MSIAHSQSEPIRDDPRLWSALSRPIRRDPPPKGFDSVGEWVRGGIARMRADRGLAARALRVRRDADSLRTHSDAALRALLEERRDDVLRDSHAAQTTDRAAAPIVETIRRLLGLTLHPEQIMGGLAMCAGTCVEMATGEGKTVTGIIPAAILAWHGRGVHVATVNDYLARRDADTLRPVFRSLGLDVGVIQNGSKEDERRDAYAKSVTYVADKQLIFDYLRDRLKSPHSPRMVTHLLESLGEHVGTSDPWSSSIVQRGHYACIVDEADSILIDEAVTPAIIASERQDVRASRQEIYEAARHIASQLNEGSDFIVDRRLRRVTMRPEGRARLDDLSLKLPEFWRGPRRREELVVQALTAMTLFHRDDDYVVKEGEVQIVDPSTGRILPGRQWQLGLHQAIEAKEGLEVTEPRRTTSRVSYHGYFRRYARLCGMSGTMWEVRQEIWRAYQLPVVRIPTHRPIARKEMADRVFLSESAKLDAIVDHAIALRARGQPVLIGTRAVKTSDQLASMLAARGVDCRVLNATREAEEADIVALAGISGTITVSTNMAGRGTDIRLDERSREAGGLAVLATERHDERRVDRQLFGRSGRQGDPGSAQAFVCLEDPVIRRFGIRPLVALARATPPPFRGFAGRLLWWQAQSSAASRSATIRAELAKSEAHMDMSLKGQNR